MDKTLISIIIPAFNEEQGIAYTLGCIQQALQQNQDARFEWEIIVCDNNSSDETAAVAVEAGATVVVEPVNQIGRARNTGARHARGDWFLFIDADSYPPPGLIADVLALIRTDKWVGCGTTVTAEDGPLWNRLRIERLNPFFRLFRWCGGAFIGCEADAFRAIEGFSDDLYALEEVDFVVRLKRYARQNGKGFTILHRHPVITSARKGEVTVRSLLTLVLSTLWSVVLLSAYMLLPARWCIKGSPRLLGYWYNMRRRSTKSL